jgi:hypothetical protein
MASRAQDWEKLVCRLINIHSAPFAIEANNAIRKSKERVVLTNTNIRSGVELCTDLPNQNTARSYSLSAEPFYATSLGIRITAVPTGALSFFMSHSSILNLLKFAE